MSEPDTKALLLEIAGFLTLIADGHIAAPEHAKAEARELLNKIGSHTASRSGRVLPVATFECRGGPGHDDPDNSGLCIVCGGTTDGEP